MQRDHTFTPPSRPQAVPNRPGLVRAVLAFTVYLAALSVVGALEKQDPAIEATCTAEEVAEYEARGWDAYECDGDKQAAAEREQ